MSTGNKRIAQNTLLLYCRMLVVMVVTLYTSRVILNALGVSDYGIYNVVGGVVTMMSFINGAMSSASSRFLTYALGSGDQDKLNETFSASLNLHILVAIGVVLIGETLGMWLMNNILIIPEERIDAAYWILHFSIITTAVNFTQIPYSASIISHESMKIYAYVGLYEAFSKLIIAYLISIINADKLIIYGLFLMLNTLGIQFFYRIYLTRKYEECRFRIVKNKTLYKSLLKYTGWELFGGIASVSQGQVMNIILNGFFGPVVNAARAVSVQIQSAITGFIQNFLTASRPQIVKKCATHDYEGMYKLMFLTTKFSFLLMLMLSIPIMFEIKFILSLWLGNGKPEYTETFAVLILITELFQIFDYAQLSVFHAIGRIKTGSIIGGTLLFLSLPVSYIVLKQGGQPYIVFIIMFVFKLLNSITDTYLIYRYVPFSVLSLLKTVHFPCFMVATLGVLAPFLITSFMVPSFVRLLITIAVTEVILIALIYSIALSKQERQKIEGIVKTKLKYSYYESKNKG